MREIKSREFKPAERNSVRRQSQVKYLVLGIFRQYFFFYTCIPCRFDNYRPQGRNFAKMSEKGKYSTFASPNPLALGGNNDRGTVCTSAEHMCAIIDRSKAHRLPDTTW